MRATLTPSATPAAARGASDWFGGDRDPFPAKSVCPRTLRACTPRGRFGGRVGSPPYSSRTPHRVTRRRVATGGQCARSRPPLRASSRKSRTARSSRMWPASVVPVRATIPTSRAKRKTTWAGDRPCRAGDPGELGAGERRAVRRQEREPLVRHPARGAERPDLAVPPGRRVAPVLDEPRADAGAVAERRQLVQADVAHPEEPRPPALVDSLHRPPRLPVGGAEAVPPGRAVEHVRVDDVRPQVLERARERLLDLGRDRGVRGRTAAGRPARPGR